MNGSLLRSAARQLRASPLARHPARRWASSSATYNWEDPLAASELFTEEELAIQDTARQYCQERLMPRVLGTIVPFLDLWTFSY
jgi:glutaryl-CoA dehydrogenase